MGLAFALVIVAYLAFLLFVVITVIMNFSRKERECRNPFSEALLFFSEVLFTVIGPVIGFMRYDTFGPDIPFSKHHVMIIIVLVITSSISYWISRFTLKVANPFIRIMA